MRTKLVRLAGLVLFPAFLAVGGLFLLDPEWVLKGMNSLGEAAGVPGSPLHGAGYFTVMAASYMGVVTILAWRMLRHPSDPVNPLLLSQAKAASALFSLVMHAFHAPHFILLVNGILDGLIAIATYSIYRYVRSGIAGGRTP